MEAWIQAMRMPRVGDLEGVGSRTLVFTVRPCRAVAEQQSSISMQKAEVCLVLDCDVLHGSWNRLGRAVVSPHMGHDGARSSIRWRARSRDWCKDVAWASPTGVRTSIGSGPLVDFSRC